MKNIEINSKKNDNIINFYKKFLIKNKEVYLSKENLKDISIYDCNIFNNIYINPDGNGLYHSKSYHLFGKQDCDENIGLKTYNYLINNKTFIYVYCYLENNSYYLDIKLGKERIKKNFSLKT